MGDLPPHSDERTTDVALDGLLRSAAAGDERALAGLHRRFDPPLVRYLRATLEDGAPEIAARSWLSVCGRLDQLESASALPVALVAEARRQIERGNRLSLWPTRPRSMTSVAATTPEDFSAVTAAGQAAASRIADVLPADQADVVLLAAVVGLTVDEIVETTGRSHRVVRALQDEASRSLEQAFGDVGFSRLLQRAARVAAAEPPAPLVAAMTRAARREPPGGLRPRTVVATKAAVVAVVILGSTSAAAASGALPEPVQHRLASVASHVGVELPDPDAPAAPEPPDVGSAGPEAEPAPMTDANAETHGAEVSDVAHDPALEGADKGAAVSDTARDGHGPAPAATPPQETGPPPHADPPDRTDQPAVEPGPPSDAPKGRSDDGDGTAKGRGGGH